MLFQADRLPLISPYGHFNHNHLVRRSLINTTIRSLPDATFISPVRSSFRYNLSSETAHRQATFSFLLGLLPQFHSSPCRPSICNSGRLTKCTQLAQQVQLPAPVSLFSHEGAQLRPQTTTQHPTVCLFTCRCNISLSTGWQASRGWEQQPPHLQVEIILTIIISIT